MPKRYVLTDVLPGGDGSSALPYARRLEAWQGELPNMVGGETWEFYCAGITEDEDRIIQTLPTSGGAIIIRWLPWHTFFGAESDHPNGWYRGFGVWSDQHYRHNPATAGGGAGSITNIVDWGTGNAIAHQVEFCGIQLGNKSDGGTAVTPRIIEFRGGNESSLDQQLDVHCCRLKLSNDGSNPRPIRGDAASGNGGKVDVKSSNNLIIYDGGNQNASAHNFNDFGGSIDREFLGAYSTVVYNNGGEDVIDDVGRWACKLIGMVCWGQAPANVWFDLTGGNDTFDYCANVDPGSRGANGWALTTNEFNDWVGQDYRPNITTPPPWAFSITHGVDADVPTYDIRGRERNTGAAETTSAGCFAREDEGGSGDILTVQDANQAQTADNIVLETSSVLLSVDDTRQTQSAENVELDPGFLLALDDVAQQQTADNVELDPGFLLALDDVAQQQTADNIILTQAYIILPDNVSQGQTADGITLAIGDTVIADPVSQAQSADNVVLSAKGVIALENVRQAQTAEELILLQNYLLQLESVVQQQSADNIDLDISGVTLEVQDAFQNQFADIIDLTQANVLQINSVTQQQLADTIKLGGLVVGSLDGHVVAYATLDGKVISLTSLAGNVVTLN